MSLLRTCATAVALLLATVAPLGGEETPAAGAWSAPRQLSHGDSAWFPEVVGDAAGRVYAFWATGDRLGDSVEGCEVTATGCQTYEAARRAGTDGNYNPRPAAVADPAGWLHMVWRAKGEIVHQRLFLPDPIDGWSLPPYRLGGGAFSAIAVAPDGTLHAAENRAMYGPEQEAAKCLACGDIYYNRSEDGGTSWSKGLNQSRSLNGSDKPQFAVRADEVVLVWEEGHDFYVGRGTPEGIMLVVSHDGGRSWDPPIRFFDPADPPHSPVVGFDRNGSLLLVWRQNHAGALYFRRSTDQGRSWSEPQRIEGVARRVNAPDELDNLAMRADAAGHLHLLATGRAAPESTSNALFHLEWNGEAWSPPVEVFRTGGAAEWPRLAVTEGNRLHAVWFERPEGEVWATEKSNYRIWYASATSAAAPHIAPVAWPKPARPPIDLRRLNLVLQTAGALLLVGGVIRWARRRGL